jgi:hypothetical protein
LVMACIVLIFLWQELGRLGQMVNSNFSIFNFAAMVYPTFTMVAYAAFVVAVLLAADWYVWGRTYANDFRTPRTVKPQGDLVEHFLGRLIAVNEARVPLTEMNPVTATVAPASAEDDRQGFRKVA